MTDSSSSPTTGKLHGKVTIITGGASGIGKATARIFSDYGALAVVIADIQDDLGQEVAASIRGGSYFRCDVSDESQVKALVDHTVAEFGRLDVMFSNAGVLSKKDNTVLDLDMSELDRIFAVNVRGTAACVKHAGRVMVGGGVKGSVVCTASLAASVGTERLTDYGMSKHAVLGLVRSASLQLGRHGIRVNAVSPGFVRTAMVERKYSSSVETAEKAVMTAMTLKIGKVTQPESVAEAVAFLASDEAEFITGVDLAVDGGGSARRRS